MQKSTRRIAQAGVAAIAAISLSSCALFTSLPDETSLQDRLGMFPQATMPLEQPVTIHWSDQQVPFVEAATDDDAAFALGLVHAHLRLGQMEVFRRLSQGRLMEMAGPIPQIADIEATLRIIDLGKTSKDVYAAMPPAEKQWLDRFVEGVNFYQQHVDELPHEYDLLGLDREPWQSHEILTMGRLASVDVTWLVWFRLMALRDRDDWPEIWARAVEEGTASAVSFAWQDDATINRLAQVLAVAGKWGSNSFAVHKSKTTTGSSIIASDPHLGVGLPNLWLLAGVKSPSYHAVGLMVPGIPFVAVGRNPDIAWGGTNMRSAASDLIDVSGLPEDQITTREVDVNVRWWFDRTMTVRDTPYGPILSDAPPIPARDGEVFALKWIGHKPTDELTAMLRLNRATNWAEFREALTGFSISAQNFIYADTEGNVGQVTATHLPARALTPPIDIVQPPAQIAAWETILTSRDLPSTYNPAQGYVASANNKPADAPVPIGYFFSGSDRVLRMGYVLGNGSRMNVEDAKRLQVDTYMRSAVVMRDALLARAADVDGISPDGQRLLDLIAGWDGRYNKASQGAAAFQGVVAVLMPQLVTPIEQEILQSGGNIMEDYAAIVEVKSAETLNPALITALNEAAAQVPAGTTWGDQHTLNLQHVMGAIPVIGGRYRFGEVPWPGSSDTLWKADHDLTTETTPTRYGAQSRHVSDMSDMDANWFALLGGNDGWFQSANFMDQVDAFGSGELFQIPLRVESVRVQFPHKTVLSP